MIRYLVIIIFQFLFSSALAENINVNVAGTPLVIPVPAEFKAVDPGMTQLTAVLNSMVVPANILLASFIQEKFYSAATQGTLPDLTRYLSLQANRPTINQVLTDANFNELRQYIRTQNADLAKQVNAHAADAIKQASNNLDTALNKPVDLKLGGMEMLPMHEDSERAIAYSMRINIDSSDAQGKPTTSHSVNTTTILHAKGKFLILYVNGSQDDLEWTRTVAKSWSDAILAANPSDAATLAQESAPSAVFDWNSLWQKTLLGAVIGGLIGLAMSWDKKRKKRKLE